MFPSAIDELCDRKRDERSLEILLSFYEAEANDGKAEGARQGPTGGDDNNNNDGHDYDQGASPAKPAIPTDPNDKRIAACQTWRLADFKKPFRTTEGLEYRGRNATIRNRRTRFLQHFDVPRNYDIYTKQRLQQAYTSLYPDDESSLSKPELVAALRAADDGQVLSRENDRGYDGEGHRGRYSSSTRGKRGREDEHGDGEDESMRHVRRRAIGLCMDVDHEDWSFTEYLFI